MTSNKSWKDPSVYIRHIHVEESVLDLSYTREILKKAQLPFSVLKDGEIPVVEKGCYPNNLGKGKQQLYLCRNKGTFLKECPGTSEYQCCGYCVINIGMNCPMDCVYCILQAYLNNPWISSFVNLDDLFLELDTALRQEPDRFYRIGTGEFSDSLALETITGMSGKIIEFLASFDNVILELKTKSAKIDSLQYADHQGKTMLAWSLNSRTVMQNQEIRTATLNERLEAAKNAASWGYKLGFHFDPIVYHDNWRQGYKQTITALFDKVPRDSIVWISMGALRYLPNLKTIATDRFPQTDIFSHEFNEGLDGKSRYFRTRREEMYKYIFSLLEKRMSADTCLYLCMESEEIWRKVFGFIPEEKGGISSMLDRAAAAAISKF